VLCDVCLRLRVWERERFRQFGGIGPAGRACERLALLVKHLRLQKIKDNWGLASNFIVWQLLQACLVCCFVGVISGLIATMAATAAQEALSSSSQTVNDGDARPAADSCLLQLLSAIVVCHGTHLLTLFSLALCWVYLARLLPFQMYEAGCCPCGERSGANTSAHQLLMQRPRVTGLSIYLFHKIVYGKFIIFEKASTAWPTPSPCRQTIAYLPQLPLPVLSLGIRV